MPSTQEHPPLNPWKVRLNPWRVVVLYLTLIPCMAVGFLLFFVSGLDELSKTLEKGMGGTSLAFTVPIIQLVALGIFSTAAMVVGLYIARFFVNRVPPRFPPDDKFLRLAYPEETIPFECLHCGHVRDPENRIASCPECGKEYPLSEGVS